MPVGDSNDILQRVKSLIPNRWFAYFAPNRDAVIGGLSDEAAQSYNLLTYARQQSRIATATGPWLDVVAYDYLRQHLVRATLKDADFRTLIKATILQERVTRKGMIEVITQLTGNVPVIFEPWNTGDAGGWNTPGFAYGAAGGWGSIQLPGQVFIVVKRGAASGVPNVSGYGEDIGGYGVGSIEYVGPSVGQIGITDTVIYDMIESTKPTGVIPWTQFGGPLPQPIPPPPVATQIAALVIFPGTTQFVVPADFYSLVSIEAFGQGYKAVGTAAGGGGAYSAIYDVQGMQASMGYLVQVGGPTGNFGSDTWFGNVATVLAKGATSQQGGDAKFGVGVTRYSGGAGFTNGGGGGAAGPFGPGLSSTGTQGGAGDQGFGGAGGVSGAAGLPGTETFALVGAGGGGGFGSSTGKKGGLYGGGGGAVNGASSDGVIVFTYNQIIPT